MDDEETRHLVEMRNTLVHRLRLLELSQARQGEQTPAATVMDIEGTKREIKLVEAKLRLPPISDKVAAAIGPDGQFQALDYEIRLVRQGFNDAVVFIHEQIKQVRDESREWRAQERAARQAGQTRTQLVFLVFGIILLIVLVVLAMLAGARWLS